LDFELTILGCNSAIAQHGRHPTSHILRIGSQMYMIDCGEGTQFRILQNAVKWFKINHIFISHLHGDHYYGLIGLLTTYNLLKRTDKLHIFAPAILKDIIELHFKASNSTLNYELEFIETKTDGLHKIYENTSCEVYSFPLKHKIPTTGFLFKEKTYLRRLDIDKIKTLDISNQKYKLLQQGLDIEDEYGNLYKNEDLTFDAKPSRSYAFCSDTIYDESIVEYIKNVDVLYHEATFMQDAQQRAAETMHSTSMQAASIAQKAEVKKLIIGHFSSRYADLNPLLQEAKSIFSETYLAEELKTYSI
jgi:ribonuclease Z